MHLVTIEVDIFVHLMDFAVHSGTYIADLAQIFQYAFVLTFAIADQWSKHQDAAAVRHAEDGIDDLLYALAADLPPTLGTMGMPTRAYKRRI